MENMVMVTQGTNNGRESFLNANEMDVSQLWNWEVVVEREVS